MNEIWDFLGRNPAHYYVVIHIWPRPPSGPRPGQSNRHKRTAMLAADVVNQLRGLKALADEGVITGDEFLAKKKQMLNLDPSARSGHAPLAPSSPTERPAKRKANDIAGADELVLRGCGAKGVMVTGPTLTWKEIIKAQNSRWDASLKAWFVRGVDTRALETVLRQAGAVVRVGANDEAGEDPVVEREAQIAAARQEAISRCAAARAEAHLVVCPHKRAVLVKGDTTKVKDVLVALKGKWIPSLGGYCLPGKSKSEVMTALRSDPTNTVVDETGGTGPLPAPDESG